jgi:hypothetical protein
MWSERIPGDRRVRGRRPARCQERGVILDPGCGVTKLGADGPARRSRLVSRGMVDRATANSLAADRRGPRQDDQAVKTKLLTGSCLWILDQGLGPTRACCSRNRPVESLCTWRSALKGGLDIPATHVGFNSLQREHPLRTFTRRACSCAGRVGNADFASHRSLLCEDALPVVPQPIDQGPGHGTVPRWGWSAVVLKPQFPDRNERPGFPTAKRPDIERLQGRPC